MSDNSLTSLLAWMQEPQSQVMWGWDAIAALARGKTNTLLIQDYINRFSTGSYLPPISADIQTVDNKWLEHIHGYVLDVPRLSFEIESADGVEFVKGMLTMAIMGGSQIAMEKKVDHWVAAKVYWISPLQGPKLFLDLQLERVPGVVKDDGRVYLDLRLSDNFRLTFATSLAEQRLGGAFFQDLFNSLPDAQRVYPLGVIKEGGNPLMRPHSFKLAAQSSHTVDGEGFGDGAVLVFIQMEGSAQGGMPGSDYRYLIPDDAGKDYSATVLFSADRVAKVMPMAESIMPLVTELLGPTAAFDLVHNPQGALIKATSYEGYMEVEEKTVRAFFTIGGVGHWLLITSSAMSLYASPESPLVLTLNPDNTVHVTWSSSGVTRTDVIAEDGGQAPVHDIHRYFMDLDAVYGLKELDGGGIGIGTLSFDVKVRQEDLGGPGHSAETGADKQPNPWLELFLYLLLMYLTQRATELQPRIKVTLDKIINVDTPLREFVDESIELNFGQAITDTSQYAPRDIGAFGRVNPVTTAFAISPLEPRVFIGAMQQFTVTPQAPVIWTVEHLLRNADSPGSISIAGLYTAPAGVTGNYLRVRVTASASNGFKSSALVTILPSRLTVNPLIQLCNPGDSVELEGGTLNGVAPDWELVTSDPDSGTLTPQGGKCIYTAKHRTTNETFVLDEIKVRGEGDALSVYVLVNRDTTTLTLKPDSETSLPAGQVQMRAWLINQEQPLWSMPLGGPGRIDAQTGIYTSAPDAPDRYALIFAELDTEYGLFKGQAILPLPLGEFSNELRLLSA